MGLDMYLEAENYVSGWDHAENGQKESYARVLSAAGMPAGMSCAESPGLEVKVTVAYWRKANAIHAWFVRNCADGKDDCQDIWVTRGQLRELRDLCRRLLDRRDRQEAEAELPPQEGFFFGGYEIDEWYWSALEDTVRQVDKVLQLEERTWDIYYRASW